MNLCLLMRKDLQMSVLTEKNSDGASDEFEPTQCEQFSEVRKSDCVNAQMTPHDTENLNATCDNYASALASLKDKLYSKEYYTLAKSSIYIAYNRRIHRYHVLTSRDNTIPLNENPRGEEYYDTIRLTEIPTSSNDFDEYIQAQIELTRLNYNLSNRITNDNVEDEESGEMRKALIDSIVYIQNPMLADKEAAYFEYDHGNSDLAKRCKAGITEKYDERTKQARQPSELQENIEHILSNYGLPVEVTKELVVL